MSSEWQEKDVHAVGEICGMRKGRRNMSSEDRRNMHPEFNGQERYGDLLHQKRKHRKNLDVLELILLIFYSQDPTRIL
jgi:hypothetical protein